MAELGLDVELCRGQGYHNAEPTQTYNLVGSSAAEWCTDAIVFYPIQPIDNKDKIPTSN